VDAIESDTPTEEELSRIESADLAVVVAGLTYKDEGEFIPIAQEVDGLAPGGDRASLALPVAQAALIRTVAARAKKTVVVLEAGSAVVVRDWVDAVDGLVMAWYPGMQGGTAIAEVLFGDVEPSGRLPVTFPRDEEQLPLWDITSEEVSYGFLHGYRLLDDEASEPEFPFGFGLGYARTGLSNLRLDRESATGAETVTVSVDVENLSDRAAVAVVQVYASAPSSGVQRAPRVLVGFRRVRLEPESAKTVQIAVPVAEALSHWDTETGGWALEATEYRLHVGTSSRDLPLTAPLEVP
jgi:beta-glucosidase